MQTTHLAGASLVAVVVRSIGARHEGAHDLLPTARTSTCAVCCATPPTMP